MGSTDSKNKFKDFLLSQGLKSTNQRELILEEFLRAGSHLSTEELYLRLRKKHPRIGYATVHRSLKLFAFLLWPFAFYECVRESSGIRMV